MFMAMELCAKTLICPNFYLKKINSIPWWICYSHMISVIILYITLDESSPLCSLTCAHLTC